MNHFELDDDDDDEDFDEEYNPFSSAGDDIHRTIENEEIYVDDRVKIKKFVAGLPLLSPQKVFIELEKLGYKGQDEPRRALSLMAYRHIRRLKRLHLESEPRTDLPPKQNVLMLGPTGCGKTYLVELLFQNVFKLPTVIVDITSFTESGYVGDSVNTILTRLILNADSDADLASCGVICLDEFDKLASASSNARFAGAGTTKDVSGYGVQRELLAMLQGTKVIVPMDYGFSEFGYRAELSTADIPFVACGAFSGFNEMLKLNQSNIGFQQKGKDFAETLSEQEAASFQKYGFLPELIGRFSRIVSFAPLSAEVLHQILHDNILPQFKNEFRGENLHLNVTDEAINFIVKRSEKRGTGARGLNTELITAVEKAAFETFAEKSGAEVLITLEDGKLVSEVK